ncbi:MAG: aminotransferase class V-fold PLP-dependent enzyme [Moraxella sp.]|nr:aminotransferase class V-fold PLP-dependent enzyme [Moraxella sp.]
MTDELLEYSVVYTDRALNHMSPTFMRVMTDLSDMLKTLYRADAVALIPGGGTYAMEAVARQLATDKSVLVVRNGWFSYRWTQILEQGNITSKAEVLLADCVNDGTTPVYAPHDIDKVVAHIHANKPQIVFAPHVETASGIMLTDDYIKALAQATHEVGGLLVIDCIASGCVWLDMQDLGIDMLISAPQKGFSSTPCAGMVMMSSQAVQAVDSSTSTSFAADLKAWLNIMRAYEHGGHAYHATMPTDGLKQLRDVLIESRDVGFETLKSAQIELGQAILAVLTDKGVLSVAAPKYQAAGVIVCHTDRDDVHKGAAFRDVGVQIAAGVPLKVGEPNSYKTFRLGLFGLTKLTDIDKAVNDFKLAADKVFG